MSDRIVIWGDSAKAQGGQTTKAVRRFRQEDGALLTQQHIQEALSKAYIQAVAGKAGLVCSFYDFDYGIDLTVSEVTHRSGRRLLSGFKVDIQAKSSVSARVDPTEIFYSIERKSYDDLIMTDVGTQRILVLLVLPRNEDEWFEQSEEQLLMRRCAYWLSLEGWEPTTNDARITISIPRINRLTVESLRAILETIRQGDRL
ncbi:MAG TPA: DUF4365 domain-containing protein [Isosphaeraceae bacterium]|nr:DUF4365 domain-containing protein [Isosphaeraceae bacterium]